MKKSVAICITGCPNYVTFCSAIQGKSFTECCICLASVTPKKPIEFFGQQVKGQYGFKLRTYSDSTSLFAITIDKRLRRSLSQNAINKDIF